MGTSVDAENIGASERALADLRGRYVGAVFQRSPAASLNPVMTVAQQIALPLRLHYDLTKAERADRVNALLSKVGLDLDMAGKYPHELSGGQQQRVGIATALITYRDSSSRTNPPPHSTPSRNARSWTC